MVFVIDILLEWSQYAVYDYKLKPETMPYEIAAWVCGQLTQLVIKSGGCDTRWHVVFDDV